MERTCPERSRRNSCPPTLTMSKHADRSMNQPLSGVRVLVGRARHQAGALSAELRRLGAQVIEIPFIEIRKPRSFQPLDEALNALEAVASDFRADPSWSPLLLDGPRVLGVESLSANGTSVRLQVRTAATRQDDVARELRRRVQMELAERGIQVGGVQRMQLVVTEPEARPIARE